MSPYTVYDTVRLQVTVIAQPVTVGIVSVYVAFHCSGAMLIKCVCNDQEMMQSPLMLFISPGAILSPLSSHWYSTTAVSQHPTSSVVKGTDASPHNRMTITLTCELC